MHNDITHQPVLWQEVLHFLHLKAGDRFLDCTVGGAGHSFSVLQLVGEKGFLWGIDRDSYALQRAESRLQPLGYPFELIHGNFSDLTQLSRQYTMNNLDAIMVDLGTSMFQLKMADRGFSFMAEAPLDMRMNPAEAIPQAADIVNHWSERELAELFWTLGEERQGRRIAQAIVKARPLRTTLELAAVVERVMPRQGKRHPATKVFQALRMAVNQELESLQAFLPAAVQQLKTGGRLAVITFHSLEDRAVKTYFKLASQSCVCPPRQPVCTCQHQATLRLVTTKAVMPSPTEIAQNPSARSAKLRVVEKL